MQESDLSGLIGKSYPEDLQVDYTWVDLRIIQGSEVESLGRLSSLLPKVLQVKTLYDRKGTILYDVPSQEDFKYLKLWTLWLW